MNTAELPKNISTDRRQHQRNIVNYAARVDTGASGRLPCRVINISAMGALLEFEQYTILPAQFRLGIEEKWFEADCAIRHQDGRVIGVLFTSSRQRALATFGN
jgi:PilZ domain